MASTTLANTPNSPSPIITFGYGFMTRVMPWGYMHIDDVEVPRRRGGRSSAARTSGKPLIVTPPIQRVPEICYKVRITFEELNGIPVIIPVEGIVKRCFDDTKKPRIAARHVRG